MTMDLQHSLGSDLEGNWQWCSHFVPAVNLFGDVRDGGCWGTVEVALISYFSVHCTWCPMQPWCAGSGGSLCLRWWMGISQSGNFALDGVKLRRISTAHNLLPIMSLRVYFAPALC